MKKTLLLAGVAVMFATGSAQAATKGLELGIEGYASMYGIYAGQDEKRSEFGLRKEIQLDFTGEVTLDNGAKIGATISSAENDSSDNEETRRSFIYAETGMGKLIVGKEYNAAYLMQVTAPAVDAELDGMDPTYNVVETGTNLITDASYDMSFQHTDNQPDGDKITYITPIMSGLQLGASYTPDVDEDAETGGFSTQAARGNSAMALAARYAVDMGSSELTLGAGWNKEDNFRQQYNMAANLDLGAIDLGLGYLVEEADDATTDHDMSALTAGASYENGAYRYAVSYLYKESADDDLSRYMTGVNYTYGPGMTLNGSIAYNSYESDNGNTENDATVVALGTVINF